MAGIIKVDQQGVESSVQAIAFNLNDIHENANSIVGEVRSQAAKIVEEAKDQAAQLRKNAQQEGRQAALKTVQAAAQTELNNKLSSLLPALQQAIDAVAEERERWRSHWEANVIDLAMGIAKRVLRREVAAAPDIALDLVREALELASGNTCIQIRLHPQDHQSLGEVAASLANQFSNVSTAEVMADESISPGGCVINTEYGEIDQRFESQLARIRDELV